MTDFNDVKIFGKISLADIFKQIHKNNKDIDQQINQVIGSMQMFITNPGNAANLLPVVKDLIDVNVRNNDQLVKMASIAQRASSVKEDKTDSLFNPDEIAAIIENQKTIMIELPSKIEIK